MVHTTLPNPARRYEGGVTYFVHRLANRLVGAGHEVTVFSADPAPADAAYRVAPLPAPSWATRGFLGRSFALPLFMNRIPRGFDVLHTHGDDTFLFRRRRVRSLHGSALGEMRSATRWRRRLGQALLYPLELLAALGAAAPVAKSEATRRHFPFVRDQVNYAVDAEVFFPGAKHHAPAVLFVGTLGGRKRGALLVRAFNEQVRPAIPGAELWLVSDEPGSGDGIVNCGRIDDPEQLAALYRRAWVFCLPSSYEGFGIPYIEAMASGTAVVSTPNPGGDEALDHGVAGVISEPSQLGATITRLLTDQRMRQFYEAAGLRRASAYSWERTVAGYVAIYSRLAGG